MAIRRHRNGWQVDVTVGGKRAPRVTVPTQREATELEADFKAKLLAGVPPELLIPSGTAKPLSPTSIGEIFALTRRSRWAGTKGEVTSVYNGGCWVKELGEEFQISDLTPAIVSDVVDRWVEKKAAAGTINRKVAALSVMMKVAQERGFLENTFKLPRRREYVGRLRYYTDEEVESLLAHVQYDPQVVRLMIVAVDTGMRLGELLGMIVRDVDLANERVDLGITKSNKRRAVPMTIRVKAALIEQMAGKTMPHETIWPSYMCSSHLTRIIRAWKRERGLPDTDEACFHTFRHTTCSRLMMRGVPIHTVMAFMGHANIETTMRYAHLAPNSLELAKGALEGNH